jgi:hypothetical protein
MKDAASCDKPRGGASDHRSVDFPIGQPGFGNTKSSRFVGKRTRRSETSKYSEEKKEKSISLVAASERETA